MYFSFDHYSYIYWDSCVTYSSFFLYTIFRFCYFVAFFSILFLGVECKPILIDLTYSKSM